MSGRTLPSKVSGYLRRLQFSYTRNSHWQAPTTKQDMALLAEVISACRVHVREDTAQHYDDVGHDVLLFLPMDIIAKIDLGADERLRRRLTDDLNKCAASTPDEFIHAVNFEPEDQNDREFRDSRHVDALTIPSADSASFWKPGQIRLFISHRDSHKREARDLADRLEEYGISAFVAHDTIEPMSEWRDEIRKGLQTMEVMLAFVTDDFDASPWTNQEVGYALGRGVPVISLQLEQAAPSGFLERTQAIKARINQAALSATEIYRALAEKLNNSARLQGALVSAFVASPDFNETRDRFDRLNDVIEKLTDEEVQLIRDRFKQNDQLHNSIYLGNQANRLLNFLARTTGQEFTITGKYLAPVIRPDENDDEIPF